MTISEALHEKEGGYRCFHCNKVFDSIAEAKEHAEYFYKDKNPGGKTDKTIKLLKNVRDTFIQFGWPCVNVDEEIARLESLRRERQ